MKNSGWPLTWQKGVFCLGVLLVVWFVVVGCVVFVLFFEALMILWFVLGAVASV